MDRRFFGFVVHAAVVTLTVASAGRILESHDSPTVTRTREEFGNGPIRLELRATNSDDGDLGALLETILNVKDFVMLVHVIAVNHLNGIDLGDVLGRFRETRNRRRSRLLSEDEERDGETDSKEIIYPNDNVIAEFQTRQKLMAVVSNFRTQPETLKLLSRHSRDVVRNVLMQILADLKNHSRTRRRYKAAHLRRQVALIEEIAKVMKQTIAILRMRSGGMKKIIEEAPNSWDDELPGQPTRYDSDNDPLSSLYAETKILRRLILENSALCDDRRGQEDVSYEDEGADDLNAAFGFFTSSSRHFRISDELQNSLKVVLNRIMKNHDEKIYRQALVDCKKQKLTNQVIKNIRSLINLRGELNVHHKDEEVRLMQSEKVTPSDSEGVVSKKSNDGDNANVQELQISIDNDPKENSNDVMSKGGTIKDDEEEESTTTNVASTEALNHTSPEQETHAVHINGDERKETTMISVTEYKETPKIAERMQDDMDKNDVATDSITEVTEAYQEINEIDHTTELFIDTTVSEGYRSTTRNDNNTTYLSTDIILIEVNEGKPERNNTADLSMDRTTPEKNKDETMNSTADLSLETIVNKGTEEINLNSSTNIEVNIIALKGNEENIENNRTTGPPSNTITTDHNDGKTYSTNDPSNQVTNEGNNEKATEKNNEKTTEGTNENTTEENNEKKVVFGRVENNTTERNSPEVDPTIIAPSTNESHRKDAEDVEGNSKEPADLKPTELPADNDEYEIGSSENQNTNININTSRLRIPLHLRKNKIKTTNVIEIPDIVTTMRFGSYDTYDKKIDKKANGTAAATSPEEKSEPIIPSSFSSRSLVEMSPGKEIARPPERIDRPIGRELVPPSKEIISNATSVKVVANDSQLVDSRNEDLVISVATRKSLGPSPDIPRLPQVRMTSSSRNSTREDVKTERKKKRKKNIMDIILESISSIVADNATHWTKSTDHKKSQRNC